jgi:TetR/AcrR family fatty acid metabolism transcriptional regulator
MRERKRRPKEERRQRIIELSKRVFSKYGVRKTIMEDIAKEIGFTAAAIYYYFDSKDDLFKACLQDEISKVVAMMEEEIKNAQTPQEKLKKIVEAKVEGTKKIIKNFNIGEEIVGELRGEIERLGLKELASREIKLIEDTIKEGVEKGAFKENIDIKRVTFIIHTLAKELASKSASQKDISDTIDIILSGIEKK